VILAAGRGNRLLPLTADRPKCMLKVGDRPILLHQIATLEAVGVRRIEVVIGHGAALVEAACRTLDGERLRFARNEHFDTTTSLWSLGCTTLEPGPEGLMILNSDVLLAPALAARLLADRREQVLLADFGGLLGEEEMKIRADADGRIRAISKALDPATAQAENLGVLKVGREAAVRMLALARDPDSDRRGLCWVPDAIQQLLGEIPFYALSTGGLPWIEIDYAHPPLRDAAAPMNPGPPTQPNPLKIELRRRILAARQALPAETRREVSAAIMRHVLRLIELSSDPIESIALYASFGHEVETHELIAALLARRLRVALPYIVHRPKMLEMRVIDRFPEGLRRSDFGILEPEPLLHPVVLAPGELDLVLVPCVAFDRRGNRLGYGAGYYDRWLTGEQRGVAVGLAFAMQTVDALPTDPWDRRVDGIVTETGLIDAAMPWRA
jgi:5-formyltetrahydrofolate cyclo-ligase